MSTSLRIIFAGTSNFSARHLNTLLSSGHNIVGVLTKPDRPAERGKQLTLSPVKILAKEKKCPIFQPISLYQEKNQQAIADLNADIIIVVDYGLIFPREMLDIPRFGCINVHGSLLPRWRGAAPIQRSILAGDIETGITIIQMDTGLDTGDILYKLSCPITDKDTSITLYEKLLKLSEKGLIEVLQQIVKGKAVPEIQNESLATYAKKISKSEARINWSLPAIQLERHILAFNPWPISWLEINRNVIKIWKASAIETQVNKPPGTIIEASKKGIYVSTIKGIINLKLLQPAGKKIMSAQDFLNSRREWFIPGIRLI